MAKKSQLTLFQIIKAATILFVGVPLWFIFSAAARHIPLKSMRHRGDQLQMPVITYEHVDSGERIIFLAVMHIADAAYYAELQGLIEEYPKYSVLYEMISKLSPEERTKLTEDETVVFQRLETTRGVITLAQEVLGVVHQTDGLEYPSTWIRTDLSMYELLQKLARSGLSLSPTSLRTAQQEKFRPFLQWFLNNVLRNFSALVLLMRLTVPFSKRRKMKEVFLDTRNEIGVAHILRHVVDRNVITIWGAEHLGGMNKMLRKEGFREIERRWINAYRSRDYSFWSVIKSIAEDTQKIPEPAA